MTHWGVFSRHFDILGCAGCISGKGSFHLLLRTPTISLVGDKY
jgi:hypothetical protein